jgi:membrane-bound inhibitor of C-type lysozyme
MDLGKITIFAAAVCIAVAAASSASAQTFQTYHCADGTQFVVGFFEHDTRAYLQLDGGPLTLARRFALSGARYSGHGVTLKITRQGTTLKHARRPVTACELA